MTDEYATLREAHAAGATILGVEHDGRMHIIKDPEWTCPPSRYLAVVPYWMADHHPAEAPVAWIHDAENYGNALNEAAWVFVEECPEKSALLFNNTKVPLRAAILKYAETVAKTAKPDPEVTALRAEVEHQSLCAQGWFDRAYAAEQAVTRVRALADRWAATKCDTYDVALAYDTLETELRAALEG